MKVTVFHQGADKGEYTRVAVVNAPMTDVNAALEYAYRYTNNVMGSWSIQKEFLPMRDGTLGINGDYNKNVTVLRHRPDGMGQRSTMMGDRMVVDGQTYEVAFAGFVKV